MTAGARDDPGCEETRAARLGRILEHSANEIFVFDLESLRFSLANRRALENTGYSLGELRRMTPNDIHADPQPGEYEKRLQELREGTRDIVCFEGKHRRKDGSSYPVDERLQISNDGDSPTFLSIVLDISERKRAQEQLETTLWRAWGLVGQLAATLREAPRPSAAEKLNQEALALLSEREREVALAFLRGSHPNEIAEGLHISPHTVSNHFKTIFRKLGVHSKVELLRRLQFPRS